MYQLLSVTHSEICLVVQNNTSESVRHTIKTSAVNSKLHEKSKYVTSTDGSAGRVGISDTSQVHIENTVHIPHPA